MTDSSTPGQAEKHRGVGLGHVEAELLAVKPQHGHWHPSLLTRSAVTCDARWKWSGFSGFMASPAAAIGGGARRCAHQNFLQQILERTRDKMWQRQRKLGAKRGRDKGNRNIKTLTASSADSSYEFREFLLGLAFKSCSSSPSLHNRNFLMSDPIPQCPVSSVSYQEFSPCGPGGAVGKRNLRCILGMLGNVRDLLSRGSVPSLR